MRKHHRLPVKGERVFEITAISRVLREVIKEPPLRAVIASRCAAAAKHARRKFFGAMIKKGRF